MSADERSEVPVEYERPDAAVRDGIEEEDHEIPLWFNIGFWGLIVVGVIYIAYYEFLSDWSQVGQYEAEVAAAEVQIAAARAEMPSGNPYKQDAAAIAEGQEVYDTICAACHLPDGRGLVGPSLVDPYWKYGDSDDDLYSSVADGRPAGMPPWGAQLGSEKIWKVLAYIDTLPKDSEPGVGAPTDGAASGGAQ